MKVRITENKIFGVIAAVAGFYALIAGKAGLSYYAYTEGMGARIAGCVMLYLAYVMLIKKDDE